jgi:two-component sensor histidine kinase
MDGFDLETMLRTLLAPYSDDPSDLDLSGPEIRLPAMRVTPIGLIIHELATNAIKYGAWSADGGKIAVRWEVDDRREHNGTSVGPLLRLHWDERRIERLDGADGPAGFGSKLINAAVAQLDGTINRERKDHGISIVIDAPIIPDEGEGNHAHRQ